ncbi:DUF3089 domain-containing protein [Thermaurantiacus sp.]
MMARRFLWVVLALVVLVVAALIAWRLFAPQLLRTALVPGIDFAQSELAPAPDYSAAESWVARPDLAGNPALFAPEGFRPAPRPAAAAFFVPPTAFFGRDRWNGPLDDATTNERLDMFIRNQASAFNGIAEMWVPRYRQATLGAFLTDRPDAEQALDLAFADVKRAFAAFLEAQPEDRPLLLAGHSQGTRHLLRLLAERRDDPALRGRLIAVYAVGWPVTGADLDTIGLPACASREASACLLSWQAFAADGELDRARADFAAVKQIDGRPIGTAAMLCVNPLSGDGAPAAAGANPGTLKDDALVPGLVGARCDPSGLLLIAPKPEGAWPLVFPGGNYHAYDYNLFWAAVRADAEARASAHALAREPGLAAGRGGGAMATEGEMP